jgi:4-hydroxy-3-methylbut-2-enyl diphosphate reductase
MPDKGIEIFIAKSAGFCFGVKRAINMADNCATEKPDEDIHTLGPIIHNPQAVARLEAKKIYSKESVEEVREGTVIIRSHGVKLDVYDEAESKGLKVLDATCPFVKKAQKFVSELTAEGYSVIVVGERNHPEVRGIVSYGSADIRIAETPEELAGMPRMKKIGILAQTTLPVEKLEAVVNYCLHRTSELKVFNTICNATSIRQEESAALARGVDRMVVVGGRNSGNTRRLADICTSIQPMTVHVEVATELDHAWFEGARTVGITSGASTPNWIIEDVVKTIRDFDLK